MEYLAMKVGEEEKLERTEYLLKSLAEHGSFKDVLKQVFKHLDFKRLKMSRLVSKRWNEEACRILRKRCIFSVKSRSRDDGGPAELVKFRNNDLPLPFKVLEVHFIEEILGEGYKILSDNLQRNCEITKIRVGPIYSSDTTTALLPILQTHARTLTHLRIDHYHHPEREELSIIKQLNLMCLESLTFSVSSWCKSGLKDLLVMVINGSPKLRNVNIDHSRIDEGNDLLMELTTLPHFQNIHSFNVDVFTNTEATESVINCLECFHSLKSLAIRSRGLGCVLVDESMERSLMRLLSKFSDKIEHLDLSSLRLDPDVIEEEFRYCRNLQSLNLFEVDLGFEYLDRLPSLKKISFHRCYFEEELTLESNIVYETVDTIEFLNMHDFLSHFEWALLQRIFPNCKNVLMPPSFGICYCNAILKNEVFSWAYCKWNLSHITLDNSINSAVGARDEIFTLLTGIKKDRWEFAVNNGLDPERIQVNASLVEIKGLFSLTLKDYKITDPVIAFGLGRMQDLRFLQTNLSEEFSVVIMEKHLLHLDKITITNCCGHPFKNAKQLQMEQLFARVLSARCGCKIKTTESWRKWF